jgi:hypothetical protein
VSHDPDQDPPPEGRHRPEEEPWSAVDIDAAFAAIVARLDSDEPRVGPWPAAEDLDTGHPRAAADDGDEDAPDAQARAARLFPASRPWEEADPGADRDTGPDVDPEDEDDDLKEDFVPPDPLPPSRANLLVRLAWAGVIGGPLGLLLAAFGLPSVSSLFVAACLVAFVAGFVALVSRLPAERPDDPDDGAVV